MATYLFWSSLLEFSRAKRVVATLLIAVLIGFAAKQWASLTNLESAREQYSQATSIIVFRMLGLVCAMFSISVVTQEVEQKTIVYLVTRPIARWKIVLAKMLASASAAAITASLFAIAVSFATYGARGFSNPMLLRDVFGIGLASLSYTALFTFFSLIMNRALLIDLLYAFGWEMAIPVMPGYLYNTSIYSHLSSFALHPPPPPSAQGALFLTGAAGGHSSSVATAFFVLSGIALCLGALSCWWFANFEYIPREDSE